jgi:hypothetical protein
LIRVGFFLRQIDVRLDIFRHRRELVVRAYLVLSTLAVTQHRLRRFLIAPEIWVRDARFEGFQAFAMLLSVKDNSAPA